MLIATIYIRFILFYFFDCRINQGLLNAYTFSIIYKHCFLFLIFAKGVEKVRSKRKHFPCINYNYKLANHLWFSKNMSIYSTNRLFYTFQQLKLKFSILNYLAVKNIARYASKQYSEIYILLYLVSFLLHKARILSPTGFLFIFHTKKHFR